MHGPRYDATGPRPTTEHRTVSTAPADRIAGRTEDAPWVNEKAVARATRAANARQASGRRRHVDPTTCERDYSAEELEFLRAMQAYKARSGRSFPTWSEVLEVVRDLGYRRPGDAA
jgi:hypothetical protein